MNALGWLKGALDGKLFQVTTTLPTFYTNKKEIERMEYLKLLERRNKLASAICLAFSEWAFKDNSKQTYCNFAAHAVAKALGCNDFFSPAAKRVMLANEMCEFLEKTKEWGEVEMKLAQDYANSGYLVVAAQRGAAHGHIATVTPGLSQPSARWVTVPAVMNIGKTNFIGKGLSWAFSELPKFYMWRAGI